MEWRIDIPENRPFKESPKRTFEFILNFYRYFWPMLFSYSKTKPSVTWPCTLHSWREAFRFSRGKLDPPGWAVSVRILFGCLVFCTSWCRFLGINNRLRWWTKHWQIMSWCSKYPQNIPWTSLNIHFAELLGPNSKLIFHIRNYTPLWNWNATILIYRFNPKAIIILVIKLEIPRNP